MRVALPASISVAVSAACIALSMRKLGTSFRLPKRRKVVGYYRSEDFEPGSVRGSMDERGEPRTPGRVIAHVQSKIILGEHKGDQKAKRRVLQGWPSAMPPPARGADAEALSRAPLHAGGGAFNGSWFAPTLFGNVPPPLGHGMSERAGTAGGGCATTGPAAASGTELAPASSWFSRHAWGAPQPDTNASGQLAAPAVLPPPAVRASSSYEVMMRAESLERQGRFREAAELLAEKMQQLHWAQNAAEGTRSDASADGSGRRQDATRGWLGHGCGHGGARPRLGAARSPAANAAWQPSWQAAAPIAPQAAALLVK
jgi:hypothetical protein